MASRKKAAAARRDVDGEPVTMVLAAMEEGNSLRKSCELAKVPIGTFLRWVDESPELAEQYTRARARLMDRQAEELEEIGERAALAKTPTEVAGLRLLSDNRKWLLAKLAPKKYGEKVQVGGAEDLPPVQSKHTLSDDALMAIAALGRQQG